jgi:small GTP-binding protein|uniref:Uncharacterized protein n=1 Tax=viral metagenome TaxID=1070528 RepID=A0A6C0ITS8_9ZZZZ
MNICLLGDCESGKSSFVNRLDNKEYNKPSKTIGVDHVIVYKKDIKMKLWELSGNIKFNEITRHYYDQKDVFLIFFDINNINSFKNIEYWIQQINSKTQSNNNKILLIGNKIDLERRFDIIELNTICNKYLINYVDISIKRNINIDRCFDEIYRLYRKETINNIPNINRSRISSNNQPTHDNYIRLEDTDEHQTNKSFLCWLKSLCCFRKV